MVNCFECKKELGRFSTKWESKKLESMFGVSIPSSTSEDDRLCGDCANHLLKSQQVKEPLENSATDILKPEIKLEENTLKEKIVCINCNKSLKLFISSSMVTCLIGGGRGGGNGGGNNGGLSNRGFLKKSNILSECPIIKLFLLPNKGFINSIFFLFSFLFSEKNKSKSFSISFIKLFKFLF